MPENWQKYHFPDPTFCTPYLPYVGLCKAINERARAVGNSEDIIQVPDFFSMKEGSVSGWLYEVDRAIFELDMVNFINPDKYAELDEYSDLSEMFWTWEDLLLTGADGVEADVIDLTANPPPKLNPNWSAKWAKQRYKILNLLRYVGIESECVYWHGTGTGSTKYGAYQDALSKGATFSTSVGPFSYFYGNPWWSSYAVEIAKTTKFVPVLPVGTPALESWAVMNVKADGIFDPLGSGLTLGWHKLTAQNGAFIDDPTPPPYVSAWDTFEGDYYAGWYGAVEHDYNPVVYADFNPIFNFKEEPDNA